MTPRQLALKTADYIEANPELYRFWQCSVPKCGSPGCVIGTAAMLARTVWRDKNRKNVFGMEDFEFYIIMDKYDPSGNWHHHTSNVIKALRAWADTLPEQELEPSLIKFMSTLEVEHNVNAMSAS